MIVDSGNRREFESGAVRDIAEGKGRCDLLPLDILTELVPNEILSTLHAFMYDGDLGMLESVLYTASKEFNMTFTTMCLELSIHYEDGCKKYGERNWEKGIPVHCFIDSAIRHYLKYLRGDNDERHDRAFLWNIVGAWWTMEHHPELIDLPFAEKEDEK